MKLKAIDVSTAVIDDFYEGSYHAACSITKGVPKGSKLRAAGLIIPGDVVRFIFEHHSFPDLPEAANPPVVDCRVAQLSSATSFLFDLTPEQRQEVYEALHHIHGCRIYK